MGKSAEEQLVNCLAGAHAIEEALTQPRAAPKIAGDERLAAAFRPNRRAGDLDRQP